MPVRLFGSTCNNESENSACKYRRDIRLTREDTGELVFTTFCEKIMGDCKSKIKVEVIIPTN